MPQQCCERTAISRFIMECPHAPQFTSNGRINETELDQKMFLMWIIGCFIDPYHENKFDNQDTMDDFVCDIAEQKYDLIAHKDFNKNGGNDIAKIVIKWLKELGHAAKMEWLFMDLLVLFIIQK